MMILATTIAGAAGALCRYLLAGVVQRRSGSDFPVGTLAVNLTGAFLVGAIAGLDDLGSSATLAAAGFLGGFTTFSTWMIETVRLGIPPLRARAVLNLALTLVAGIVLAACGYSLTN
jgi:fluoride exporter